MQIDADENGDSFYVSTEQIGGADEPLPRIEPSDYENDPFYGDYYNHEVYGTPAPNARVEAQIKKLQDSHVIEDDGRVYQYWVEISGRIRRDRVERLLAIPAVHQLAVLKAFHGAKFSSHWGYEKTYAQMKTRVTWPRMPTKIKEFIKSCHWCQLAQKPPRQVTQLQPLPPPTRRWERIGIDLITNLPETPVRKNKYILVMVDYLTKYPEAVPLPKADTATVMSAFLRTIYCRWGCPLQLVSDQGGNLVGRLAKAVYKALGIDKLTTSPHHAQTNGMCERTNRSIMTVLRKLCVQYPLKWDELLDFALAQMRFCKHRSTQESPYLLATGQDPILPVDFINRPDLGLSSKEENWRKELFDTIENITAIARENLEKVQQKMIVYDQQKSRRHVAFEKHQLVRMFTRKRREPGKLDLPMTGPYQVVRPADKTSNAYVILTLEGTRTVNASDLLPYTSQVAALID